MTEWMWIFGAAGMWCIEASYVPQICRLHKIKRANDISIAFPLLNILGRVFALIYSISLNDPVLTLGFMGGLLMRGTFLGQVLYYRNGQRPIEVQLQS